MFTHCWVAFFLFLFLNKPRFGGFTGELFCPVDKMNMKRERPQDSYLHAIILSRMGHDFFKSRKYTDEMEHRWMETSG